MKNCKYTIIGNNRSYEHSYDELVKLLKRSPHTAYDILYSKDYNKQSRVVDRVNTLKEEGIRKFSKEFSDKIDPIGGCAEINASGYTLQSFIDSGLYINSEGKQIMPPLKVEDYLKRMEVSYKQKGLSSEEIKNKLALLQDGWIRIAEDGRDLHKILSKQTATTTYDQLRKITEGTSFSHLNDIMKDVQSKVHEQIRLRNGKESRELGDDSSPVIIKNIKLTAKLLGREDTVTAHIDYLVVKPNGSIEIFNIKTSHEFPNLWDSAKTEKYVNEFALLSRILEYNGINTQGARFNIIPTILQYDNQFQEIQDIKVADTICLSHSRGAFIMGEAIKQAQPFIESNAQQFIIEDSSIDTVNKQLKAFIPQKDVRAQGIQMTAEEYVDKNWSYIVSGKQPESGYNVVIGNKKYTITDTERKSANKQIVDLVKQHQEELINSLTGPLSAQNIVNLLEECRRYGFPVFDKNQYLEEFFYPYFEKTVLTIDGKKKYSYTWKIVKNDTLNQANLIMFENTITGQINVVALSSLNLNQINKYEGQTNILNYHLDDMRAKDNQGRELMRATYGSIEVMRTLFLLNEILPQLSGVSLGEIQIIGNIGSDIHSQNYPIQLVLPNFIKAINVLNSKDSTLNIANNFENVKSIDPVKLLINEYWDIMKHSPNLSSTGIESLKELISGSDGNHMWHLLDGTLVDSLESSVSTEIKIQRLTELINKLQDIVKNAGVSLSPESIKAQAEAYESRKRANSDNPTYAAQLIPTCCKLLQTTLLTLNQLSGVIRISESDLSVDDKYFIRPQNSANSQVRLVGKLLQDSIHQISSRLDSEIEEFNLHCLDYYEHRGYSKTRNTWVGDQSKIFDKLYRENDEEELIFKNPFDMTNGLDKQDREFLKHTLFIINKRRKFKKDVSFPYKSYKDPEFEQFIENNSESLWVPLEEASESTKLSNPGQYFKELQRNVRNYVKNPSLLFKEMYEGMLDEDTEKQIDRDLRDLQIYNKFNISNNENGRKRLFRTYQKGYFETNVQNLVIDYVHRSLQEEELNKMLLKTKGILLYLKMAGESDPSKVENFDKVVKQIEDYIQVSVFNKSIMEESSQKIIARIQPLRKAMSTAYIALSPVAAVRDVIAGALSNSFRSLTKYQTDIDVKDVMWAYKFVLGQGVHSAMDIDLLDKFNSKYLISNINREQLQEAHKTNRAGITNVSNLLYSTLRKPDFLNRMVLFMAKLKHDNSYKAYSIEDRKLVYNWRKDGRFNLLASDNKSDIEAYNRQKSLYLSLLLKFNEENPDLNLPISLSTDLPDGYTLNQIEEIKTLGDTIYGSFNKSTQAKYEHLAIGSQFGVFSTWMNGIYDVYFGKRRESSFETEKVQKEDTNGNKLWIDEYGNITTEDTGVPYLTDIPLIVQGVMRTVGDVIGIFYHKKPTEWMQTLKTEIYDSPMQWRNMKRLITDFLMSVLLAALVRELLKPAYEEHKKEGEGKDLMTNIAIELLYKGSASSFEEMRGPLPIIEYIMGNTKPAAFQWGSRALEDAYDLIVGDKTFGQWALGMQALTRSFQDSYRMYQKATVNGID